MKLPFKNLVIELDIEGIIEIESLELIENLNCHGKIKICCLIENSFVETAIISSNSKLTVILYDKDKIAFYGYLSSICSYTEKGEVFLQIEFVSKTQDMDNLKRGRVFYKQQDSYENIIKKVVKPYSNIQIKDEITNGKRMPGVLLQYEETDWEFLTRLASHFSSFLVSDSTSENARFYFGIPEFHNQVIIKDSDYEIIQDTDNYYKGSGVPVQEYIHWKIISKKVLRIGEVVNFNEVDTIVMAIHYYTRNGELIREYMLHRKNGLLSKFKVNYEILGLSLPATVLNRKQNQVQVEFDINSPYESEQPSKNFVYAIESSSFYCMPEIGSRLHIYFPGKNEAESMAVHALNADGSSVPTPNPSDKTFSSPTGASMQLTPNSYNFKSDSSGSSVLKLGVDGNILITGKTVLLDAKNSIIIGKGEKNNTPEILFTAKTEQILKVKDGASSIDINTNTQVLSDKITLKAESGDMSAAAAAIQAELDRMDSQVLTDNSGGGNPLTNAFPNGGNGVLPSDISMLTLPRELTYVPLEKDNAVPSVEDEEKQEIDYKSQVYEKDYADEIDPKSRQLRDPKYYGTTTDDPDKEIESTKPNVPKNFSVGTEWSKGLLEYDSEKDPNNHSSHVTSKINMASVYANATAYAGITTIEDGKLLFRPGAGVQLGGGVSLADMELKGYVFDKDNNAFNFFGKGEVSVWKAGAEIDAGVGIVDGELKIGGSAEAGAYIVEGGLSGGVTLAGVDVGGKVEGKVGLGVEADFGITDGKFKAKVGATVLIGGSVEIEIDFNDIQDGINDCVDVVKGWLD